MKEIIWYQGKVVGHVSGDTFYTTRGKEHIFRKCNSVNISQEVLDFAKQKGAKYVEIELKTGDKEETFRKSVKEIEKCHIYSYEEDKQWILPLDDLRSNPSGKRQASMAEWYETASAGAV